MASLGTIAIGTGVSDHEEPAARYVIAECQGFDALARMGTERISCDGVPVARAADARWDGSQAHSVDDRQDAASRVLPKV